MQHLYQGQQPRIGIRENLEEIMTSEMENKSFVLSWHCVFVFQSGLKTFGFKGIIIVDLQWKPAY